ncbi:CAP domain-containing protein [Cellulosimicrobium sp. PMB13]|uniref:CAP domain-containing protein n=1 Tax=Cellulosimicrobium sp. PMB13 TaxID=3120158 RepID=UPI003F4B0953
MAPPRTPRHRRGDPVPEPAPVAAPSSRTRRRAGAPARHLRSAPGAVGAVTAGVAAVLVLGPSAGLTAATMSGALRPEHAGRLGPVVAALPWSPGAGRVELLAERERYGTSRTLPERHDVDAAGPASGTPGTGASASGPPASGVPTAETPAADAPPPAEEPAPQTEPSPVPGTPGAPAGEGAPPPAAAPTATPPTVAAAPGPGVLSAEGAAVVELTNAERAAAGCGPLAVDDRLTAAAQLHSEDMLAQDYFDHTSLDGRSPWDRAEAQGYENPGAENIAKGQATAEEVVRAWMDSPGHRANILDCDLREIGVGHAERVWTQLFGRG